MERNLFILCTFTNIISGSGGGASSSVVGNVSITENIDLLLGKYIKCWLPINYFFYSNLIRQALFFCARYFKVNTNKQGECSVIVNAE